MPKSLKKILGVTLFEVMLVLLVASLIAVGVIKYMKHQSEVAAAQEYGEDLYTFGQAVHNYIASSGTLYTQQGLPGPTGTTYNPEVTREVTATQVTLTATGVKWLQKANAGVNQATQQPFIDDTFTFSTGLTPLVLATPNSDGTASSVTGDDAIKTVITYNPTTPNVPPSVEITGGVLYEQPTQSGKPLVIKPDLTTSAIQHANTMYSPAQGLSVFTFTVPYLDSQGTYNAAATTQGSLNSTASSSAFLMVAGADNGGNSMMGELNFTNSAGGKINNVALITMQGSNGSAQINFSNGGLINNLGQLVMAESAGSNLTLDTHSITFPLSGPQPPYLVGNYIDMGAHLLGGNNSLQSPPSTITGLTNLQFISNLSTITGLQNLSFNYTPATGNTPAKGAGQIQYLVNSNMFKGIKLSAYSLDSNKTGITDVNIGKHDVCFLTAVKAKSLPMCVVDGNATLVPYSNSTVFGTPDLGQAGLAYPAPTKYYLHRGKNAVDCYCYAVCLDWST